MENEQAQRRKSRRVSEPLSMLVFWNDESGERREAYLCDISAGGCYLNTNAEPETGERISIEIPTATASEKIICFNGSVIEQKRKFKGFGVRFDFLDVKQQSLVVELMSQSADFLD